MMTNKKRRIYIALTTFFMLVAIYSGFPAISVPLPFLIVLFACLIIAFWLFRKIYKSQEAVNEDKLELLIIYCSILLTTCILGSAIIPQPGGINLINRILSPLLGPWSRFLPPNALRLSKCTSGYLIFSGIISFCMLTFIPLSLWGKKKIFKYISIVIGLISILIWTGYGLFRILLDVM